MAAEFAASLRLRVAAVEPEIGRSRVWQWIGAVRGVPEIVSFGCAGGVSACVASIRGSHSTALFGLEALVREL